MRVIIIMMGVKMATNTMPITSRSFMASDGVVGCGAMSEENRYCVVLVMG
jgi:hypothetical protein